MRVLIAGASGLVGKELVPFLTAEGHTVVRLVRDKAAAAADEIPWDPMQGILDPASVEGFDALINLAGENIASGRWTENLKRKILDSRVQSTKLLSDTLHILKRPPKVWINASAIGYYGSRNDEILTERDSSGSGFLADVTRAWEAAATAPLRVVPLRIGMVLSPKGGGLKSMLLPFKLGLGGVIGSGKQWMSWIAIDDLLGIFLFLLNHDKVSGPVNAVATNPVTNFEFTKELGKALHRPTFMPLPAFAARLAFGEMADELLLSSTRVYPEKLEAAGFAWKYPKIHDALQHLVS